MRNSLLIAALLCSTALADPCDAPLPKPGTEFAGRVTYVGDGDMLCIGEADGGIEVRLGDFNAPELREPGGIEARDTLRRLALGREVRCLAGKRSYDRVVALCTIGGRGIGDLMREAGIAEGGR